MEIPKIQTPLDDDVVRALEAGRRVLLSGVIYTARDAAHRRLVEMLEQGRPLPFDMRGQIIYYTGPTPPRNGMPAGSAGPTTSGRMDKYAPVLMDSAGLKGMIGKGERDQGVIDAIRRNLCVYFAAAGGAGALIAKCIVKSEIVCFGDLGPEAVRRMEVRDMPLVVAIDCMGGNLYVSGPARYRKGGVQT